MARRKVWFLSRRVLGRTEPHYPQTPSGHARFLTPTKKKKGNRRAKFSICLFPSSHFLLGSTKQVLLRTPHRTGEEKEGKTSSRQNMGGALGHRSYRKCYFHRSGEKMLGKSSIRFSNMLIFVDPISGRIDEISTFLELFSAWLEGECGF